MDISNSLIFLYLPRPVERLRAQKKTKKVCRNLRSCPDTPQIKLGFNVDEARCNLALSIFTSKAYSRFRNVVKNDSEWIEEKILEGVNYVGIN